MEIYQYIYMVSVTESVFIGIGSGLLAFMLIPCCVYWLKLDLILFRHADEPLHGQAQAQAQAQAQRQRHGPTII
jgi:hypothetical protein